MAAAIVDDEMDEDLAAWARSREAPTLLVEVDPREGLLDTHVAELLAFAARVSG